MPLKPNEALDNAAQQSENGPQFGVDECQMRNRLLYEVPSNGTPTAAADWEASTHKHPTSDPSTCPRGAFHRWTGGVSGAGHVAISCGGSKCWSTDIVRDGYFDATTVEHINATWTALHYVGWTTDIDGVVVVEDAPKPTKPSKLTRVDQARDLLTEAAKHGKPKRKAKVNDALNDLPEH